MGLHKGKTAGPGLGVGTPPITSHPGLPHPPPLMMQWRRALPGEEAQGRASTQRGSVERRKESRPAPAEEGGEGRGGEEMGRGGMREGGQWRGVQLVVGVAGYLCDGPPWSVAVGVQLLLLTGGRGREGRGKEGRGEGRGRSTPAHKQAHPSCSPVLLQW